MSGLRKTVLGLVIAVFLLWAVFHFRMIAGDANGTVRFVLGILFALLILFRWKGKSNDASAAQRVIVPVAAVIGAVLALAGIIFRVGQFEWLGLILLLYSSMRWVLPGRFSRDIPPALFVLYWIHPLPGQLFSKFQLLMQVISVKASEWLLHCLNVRVWADGIVLHNGFQTFLVPEACSGMVTAVTVLLVTLGICILFRFRWFEAVALLLIGTAQVLAMNILRIVFMVIWSARMPQEWAGTFLHDTLGFLLLAAILLVQLEAMFWKISTAKKAKKEKGIEAGEIEEPERATILPKFWRIFRRWVWVGLAVLVLAGGVAFAIYKRRPEHRAAMISEVIDGLMERNLETAEKAVDAALKLKPDDRDLVSKKIQVKVLRGKYVEALADINTLKGGLNTLETVMKSFALMSLNHPEEAISLIDSLPEAERNVSGVSMIRAEYAVRQDRSAVAAAKVVIAGKSSLMIGRIRAIFPYLAAHRQWKAIVDSDNENIPYRESSHALIAVYARMQMNDVLGAARALKAGLAAWPNDPQFIGSLYLLAARRPGGEWENLFADNITANVGNLDIDRLASYMEYCFKLSRPDLAWLLYLRLREVDPRDPALYLMPAQFGDVWFAFRCHQLGIPAENGSMRINLKPFYFLAKNLEPFKAFWERVPLTGELLSGEMDKTRAAYLQLCLTEIDKRKKAGSLNRRMHMAYPTALIMAGKYKEAEAVLNELESRYPDAGRELLYQRAMFYDQQGKWQDAYETLMKYRAIPGGDNLSGDLMLIKAMMNLNMGVCAMEVAERAREAFPDSNLVLMAMAAIWDIFGFKDQALFLLSHGGEGDEEWNARAIEQLLYETGCFKQAEKLSRSSSVSRTKSQPAGRQGLFTRPAEWVIVRRWPAPLSDADMDREAVRLEKDAGRATSPFFRELRRLSADWHRKRGRGDVSSIARWAAVGRNEIEKAGALHQLAMNLAREKRYAEAAKGLEDALVLLPQSEILWRALIALTEGNPNVVQRARTACPNDPDIWMASIVTRMGREGGGSWIKTEIEKAAAEKKYPPGTMVCAGDFLLRKGFIEEASIAAHNAIDRCRGALPAYILGLQCALTTKDMKWALSCVLNGVENARDPGPFYKLMVYIKSLGRMTDADGITALEYLRERFPTETQWSERLGDVYFQKGDLKRAMAVLDRIALGNLKGVKVRSLLLAAESARQEGEYAKAIGILENAYTMHPEMSSVLNNLVYNLVRDGNDARNLARAKELLPKLLEIGGKDAVILDTIAMVYFKAGDLSLAKQYSQKAIEMADKNDYAVQEINLNAAEIMCRMGEYIQAKELLETIRRASSRTQVVESGIRELLDRIEAETGKR